MEKEKVTLKMQQRPSSAPKQISKISNKPLIELVPPAWGSKLLNINQINKICCSASQADQENPGEMRDQSVTTNDRAEQPEIASHKTGQPVKAHHSIGEFVTANHKIDPK